MVERLTNKPVTANVEAGARIIPSELADLFSKHTVNDLSKSSIPASNELLAEIAQLRGWSYHVIQETPYLGIDGTLVRYYDYPPEKYSFQVRKLVLTNSVLELSTLLGNKYASLSIEDLNAREVNLRSSIGPFAVAITDPIKSQDCKELAKILFFAGGRSLISYVDSLLSSTNSSEIRQAERRWLVPGLDKLADAIWLAEFGDLSVYGKGPDETFQVQRKLARNMKFIASVDYPIEAVVSGWYQKLSMVKQDMMSLGSLIIDDIRDSSAIVTEISLIELLSACFDLVDVRRSESEYAAAVHSIEDKSSKIESSYINDLVWLTIVREPFRYGDFSGADLFESVLS